MPTYLLDYDYRDRTSSMDLGAMDWEEAKRRLSLYEKMVALLAS